MLDIADVQAYAYQAEKIKLDFEFDIKKGKKTESVNAQCWLITDNGLSFAAKQRVQNALMQEDLLELNLCVLVDRIRFGADGTEQLNIATARQQVEQPNPMFAALLDAAFAKIKELKGEQGDPPATGAPAKN